MNEKISVIFEWAYARGFVFCDRGDCWSDSDAGLSNIGIRWWRYDEAVKSTQQYCLHRTDVDQVICTRSDGSTYTFAVRCLEWYYIQDGLDNSIFEDSDVVSFFTWLYLCVGCFYFVRPTLLDVNGNTGNGRIFDLGDVDELYSRYEEDVLFLKDNPISEHQLKALFTWFLSAAPTDDEYGHIMIDDLGHLDSTVRKAKEIMSSGLWTGAAGYSKWYT